MVVALEWYSLLDSAVTLDSSCLAQVVSKLPKAEQISWFLILESVGDGPPCAVRFLFLPHCGRVDALGHAHDR